MKTGDKVRVKSLEEVLKIEGVEDYKDVGGPGITDYMFDCFGEEGIVTSDNEDGDYLVLFDKVAWFFREEWLESVTAVRVREIFASLEKNSDLYYKIKNSEEAMWFATMLQSNNYYCIMYDFVKLFESGKECLILFENYQDYTLVYEDEALSVGNVNYELTKRIINPTYDDLKPLFIKTDSDKHVEGVVEIKTSEFIKEIKKLGYEIRDNVYYIDVYRYGTVARVYKNTANSLDTAWGKYIPNELLDVLVKYVKTPIEERKRVKKYYLYSTVLNEYFNYYVECERYHFDNNLETENFQTQFTEEEIENHKFKDIMELLVKEEVEDE